MCHFEFLYVRELSTEIDSLTHSLAHAKFHENQPSDSEVSH